MLVRLEAGDELAAVRVAQLGSGNVAERDQAKAISAIQTRADGGRRPRARKASKSDLAGLGIGLTIVPPRAKPDAAKGGGDGDG
ncbi:MAG: hypothetical protein AAFR88_09705 [Pseudomonadota bacterium]